MKITQDLMSGVALVGVYVRELRFLDNLEETGRGKKPPSDMNIEIETAVTEDGQDGRVRIKLTVTPKEKPASFREIVATVEGHFRASEGAATTPMDQFLDRQGAVILMPFARDAVATATQKTRFGTFLIQPINVAAMLDRLGAEGKSEPPDVKTD